LNKPGYFPILLQDILWDLGNTMKPLYITDHYTNLALGDYYLTRVHIRERSETSRGLRPHSVHDSATPTPHTLPPSATLPRELFGLFATITVRSCTPACTVISLATSATEEMVVPLGEDGEDHINILIRVTTALTTDLEGITAEFDRTHEKLQEA
jgi:hypothetical protein